MYILCNNNKLSYLQEGKPNSKTINGEWKRTLKIHRIASDCLNNSISFNNSNVGNASAQNINIYIHIYKINKTINYWFSEYSSDFAFFNNNTRSKYNMHGKTPSSWKCRENNKIKNKKKKFHIINIYLKSRQNVPKVSYTELYCILCQGRSRKKKPRKKKTCK